MRAPRFSIALFALVAAACHSTDATVPVESLASINVNKVTATTVAGRADRRVTLDVTFKNESNISIDPVLCSYSLQGDVGGSDFADLQTIECQASGGGSSAIAPFSQRSYTFDFFLTPAQLMASSNYRLQFQVFLEGDRRATPLASNLFAIPGAL